MIPQIRAARGLPIQHMEPPRAIRNLPLLVQNTAPLWNGVNDTTTCSWPNGCAGAHAGHCCAGIVFPRLALVIGVGVAKVVVGHDVGSLTPSPRDGYTAVDVVKAVDVGIVVAALKVAPDL